MKNNFSYSWRAYLIYIFLGISLFILVFRIVSLKYIEGDFLTSKGKIMLKTSRSIPAIRGSILDRNNFPLAVSINQYDLYALKEFSEEDFKKLRNLLKFSTACNSNFDDRCSDAHFVSFLFYCYCIGISEKILAETQHIRKI